jgi:hypothetical protein
MATGKKFLRIIKIDEEIFAGVPGIISFIGGLSNIRTVKI